jgi:hypothetical protein
MDIKEYLKRGPTKGSLPFKNEYSYLSSNIMSSLSVRNDIENTGKSCILVKSNHLDLIM